MELVYYTIGFNHKYLDVLHLSIQSLRKKNQQDILVICDESLVQQCVEKLKCFNNVVVSPCKDSISGMDSSMKKLLIFDYDIEKYEKILFIDSDILVDVKLKDFFDKFVDDNKLYAFAEFKDYTSHDRIQFSLMNYTDEDIKFFIKNKIYVFNCGLFAFLNTSIMKQHFQNVRDMITDYKGNYYYEQSFMNVYFNKQNLVDTSVINKKNCSMNIIVNNIKYTFIWKNETQRNKFFHFSFSNGPETKLKDMLYWKQKFQI